MRYFGVGVVFMVVSPFASPTPLGAALIVAGGLCFVADNIARLTEELRSQNRRAYDREPITGRVYDSSEL